MRIAAILTDLDGTLLEPDGSAAPEVAEALAWLARRGVPVHAVTSKTPAEIAVLAAALPLAAEAGFENGAGVTLAGGGVALQRTAVPLAELAGVARALRHESGAPLRSLLELGDAELAAITGLAGAALAAARDRRATLPLLVDARWDGALRAALPAAPRLRAVRGNRFLHLQGEHDKADAADRLLAAVDRRAGAVVALGDAPNDAGLLALADVAVIVPSAAGPHAELRREVPRARVAPAAHGRGWALAVRDLVGAA